MHRWVSQFHLNKSVEYSQQHRLLPPPLPDDRPRVLCYHINPASGFVKILAALSPEDRSTIKSEAILLPDKSGPTLMPASALVYDDAPWLSSRLRTLRLVHPDVGDEVR